ncbi:hydroxymethylpyrimidine synthase [Hypnocyclicus thermotrophus]|uniref:Phosphomethylpyrimidine synthase n=1 Tax=Hypnocyclicus thermotrophus TaxID=1627895 RepID=A0AA46DZY3_9FUSO|nr:phosphomethylpyrimidine synthase ThiC [Hypnocyclicus thermotrophus]TDT71979.1 hydroxymethylpyrimidine synthase [Hypnocyclicus thermotrophus]
MNYTTQMDAAKKGIFTKQMEEVVKNEAISKEKLIQKIAEGKIVIPANKNHKNLIGIGVGEGLKTKVNVNIGVSEDEYSEIKELKKVEKALEYKADAIMDLSIFGDTKKFRKKLIETSPIMIGTVPMYDAVAKYGKNIKDMTVDDLFEVVEEHCQDGVDFITVHAGFNRISAERLDNNKRLTHVVSRGGSILYQWMKLNNKENPFYEYYDRLLEICKKYDVTLSLGDGLRPGSIKDSTDPSQIQELLFLGELTKRAWEENVQVMIEGPGHIPLHEIVTNMQIEKKLCHGAPFYVLGPVVTDIAPGYDHITAAIGGAIAASNGADFLCYVTPAEHLRLPDIDDMKEGLIATRIAAHAADIAKGIKGAKDWDNAMSKARGELNWAKMFDLAIDKEKAIEYRKSSMPENDEVCTMCGDMCPIKRIKEVE